MRCCKNNFCWKYWTRVKMKARLRSLIYNVRKWRHCLDNVRIFNLNISLKTKSRHVCKRLITFPNIFSLAQYFKIPSVFEWNKKWFLRICFKQLLTNCSIVNKSESKHWGYDLNGKGRIPKECFFYFESMFVSNKSIYMASLLLEMIWRLNLKVKFLNTNKTSG